MRVLGTAARAFKPPRKRHDHGDKPAGERILQERLGTTQRARQFYDRQVTAHLTPVMQEPEFELGPLESGPAGRQPVPWVMVHVTEAYIHCSKHIPKMVPQSRVRHWGTDNPRHKGGDYFGVAASKQATAPCPPGESVHRTPTQAPTEVRV